MSRSTPDERRYRFLYIGIGALFVMAAFSQAKLQIFERSHTIQLAIAANRYTQTHIERAVRGQILAANGVPLALDDGSSLLRLDLAKIPHSEAFYMDLSAAAGISAGEISGAVDSGVKSIEWPQALTPDQADRIRAVKSEWRSDGVSIVASARREYPLGDAASCIVGVVRDGKPMAGLEFSMNAQLRGEDGIKKGLVDRSGAFLISRTDPSSRSRVDGKNVVLTIDSDLQAAAAEAVKKGVTENKADNGVAIVMQPQTGEILAMANYPSFSPYAPDGSDGDLRANSGYDPAYMSALEPGSTFKILTLAKGLDSGKVKMTDHIYCSGVTTVDGVDEWKIHCDNHEAHGDVTPETAISRSCNIAAAGWALKIGRTDFLDYLESLGLFKKPDLGLPSEARGHYTTGEWAQRLQLADMGFGQSVITTPISLADAFTIIGNGGVRVEPSLVKSIGGVALPPKPAHRIVSAQTAATVLRCMEAVIDSDSGTGKTLRIPGYRLAGKTGTAQKIGKGSSGYVANFVGFVPAQAPQAEILVMINHPTAGQFHGAIVAGPVFRDIAQAVIRKFQIPRTN